MVARAEHLIAVVDDDAGVCRAVCRTLTINGYDVRTFGSAREYLESRHSLEPACVVADIIMPGLTGVAMHELARQHDWDVPTVFMTASRDVPQIVQAMKAGAIDLLAKPFTPEALLVAVRSAVNRSRRLDGERRWVAELWRAAETLTPREAEVVALVASGRLNKQVAALIGIGEATVKIHRARAMRKLQTGSLASLVRLMDRLLTAPVRRVLDVDGRHLARPKTLDIMAETLRHARR